MPWGTVPQAPLPLPQAPPPPPDPPLEPIPVVRDACMLAFFSEAGKFAAGAWGVVSNFCQTRQGVATIGLPRASLMCLHDKKKQEKNLFSFRVLCVLDVAKILRQKIFFSTFAA